MLRALIIALIASIAVNAVVFDFGGIADAHRYDWAHHLPKALEALVALGILTEAQLNGAHSARSHWSLLWKRLVVLLTVALALRGLSIYFMAEALGLESSHLIATGLTATDPAAIGIALSLVKGSTGHASIFAGLFFLLAVESLLNDAEGLIAFQVANGTGIVELSRMLFVTFALATVFAFAVAGARWSNRFWLFDDRKRVNNPPIEPYIEVGLVGALYILAIYIAIEMGASLIGMVAIAAIIADKVLHMLQHELDYSSHEIVRERIYDYWNNIGLAVVFGVVIAFMPFSEFTLDGFGYAVGILAAIVLARVVFEVAWVAFKSRPNASYEIGISALAATCLLGVPSIVGYEMYVSGHEHDALIVLQTVMLSWLTVPPTVMFVKWAEQRLFHKPTPAV